MLGPEDGVHMPEETRSAQSYRIRAEMLRTLAEMDDYSATGQMLRQVASDYDRMAQTIETADRHLRQDANTLSG